MTETQYLDKTDNKKSTKDEMLQIVMFEIDKELYGVEILKVQEIIRLSQITHLPKSPNFIKGIINVRGTVIPVLDLREKFGLQSLHYNEMTRVMIFEIQSKKIGVVVDSVKSVLKVPSSSIQPAPRLNNIDLSSDVIDGVINYSDRLIILIDVDKILSNDEIILMDKINDN